MTTCTRADAGAGSNYPFLTSKERDNETGLDWFDSRYYHSAQGRFTSPDSFGGRLVNPQTLNLYSYVRNNPLKYIDPSGHEDDLPKKKGKKGDDDDYSEVIFIDPEPCNCPKQPEQPKQPERTVGRFAEIALDALTHPAMPDPTLRAFIYSKIRNQVGERNMREFHHFAMASIALGPLAADLEGGAAEAAEAGEVDALMELSSESIVVRGGLSELPPPGEMFSGAAGTTLEEAAAAVPHGTIRSTTVEAVESNGGTVVRAPEAAYRGGPVNQRHVNIVEGRHPSTFSRPFPNPVPKGLRTAWRPKK